MTFATRQPMSAWLSLTLLIGQVGCAPSLSEEVRATLGTIGVVSARFIPEAKFHAPARGRVAGAAEGAVTGFVGGAGGGASVRVPPAIYDPFTGLIYLALVVTAAAVGTVVGAVGGAVRAESAATVEEAEAALKNAVAALKIQEAMRDHFLKVARKHTRRPLVLLPEQGPTVPDEEVDYHSLSGEGIDTILEISVPTFGLAGGGINAPLSLFMNVQTRLIRVAEGTTLYDSILEYRSGTREFNDWTANNAQLFREELERAYQSFAEKIVEEVFLLYLIPGSSPGTSW